MASRTKAACGKHTKLAAFSVDPLRSRQADLKIVLESLEIIRRDLELGLQYQRRGAGRRGMTAC